MADQPSWLNDEVPAKSSSSAPSAATGGGSSSSSSSGGGGTKTEWKMTTDCSGDYFYLFVRIYGSCGRFRH